MYHGDINLGDTIDVKFTTRQVSGAPFTLAGTPAVSAYIDNSTTEITAGITLTVDFDTRTGLNNVRVVATSGNGFTTGTNVQLVITAGTVNSVSVVGEVIGSFSIEKRSALRPATAGRTLVVDSAGLADANAVKIGPSGTGTPQTARDIGASVLLSAGTSTGQLDFTNGVVKSNLAQILGTALTETAGQIAAAFKKFFNVATPTGTVNSIPDAVAGATGGLAIVGSQMDLKDAPNATAITAINSAVLTAISNLNNLSALVNLYGSPLLEIPDSSSTPFAFTLIVRDNEGKLVDLDSSPTIAAANAAGTDRSANLSAVSHPSTGRYTFTYSVSSAAAEESLRITCSGTVSSEGRYIEWIGAVVNYDSLTQIAAIKAKTDQLTFTTANQVDATGVTVSDKTGFALTSAYDAAKTAAQAGDTMKVSSGTGPGQVALSSGQVTVGTNNDKTGYSLASTGMDSVVPSEPAAVPAFGTATFPQWMAWLGALMRNKRTQTSTTETLRNNADNATIATSTKSDDGTTATRGKWS